MNQQPEQPQAVTPLEAFVILMSSFFFSIMPQFFVMSLTPEAEEIDFSGTALKVSLLISGLILWALPVLYLRMRKLSVTVAFRWQPVPGWVAGASVLVGIGLTVLVDELDRLVQILVPMPEEWTSGTLEMMQIHSTSDFILLFLSVVVLAGIVEESLFRGLLQGSIETYINVTRAVIYSSLGWAMIHMNPFVGVQLFLFGFMLGFITWRSGSIIPAVICHMVYNSISLLYYNIEFETALPFYEWNGHVAPLVLIAAVAVVFKGVQLIDQYYRALTAASSSSSGSSEM
ncbi:MAG: CPBP family intramembrane metalloprotease [Calditrichaeota bacterium]|nr:CPBP family intramembrane metalloprotease [Calditrichota bacterium]MCB9089016.1 CPBP family intramembrane metalloprotease [Calditrichia bacterium]